MTSFMSFMKHWDSKTFQSNTPILSLLTVPGVHSDLGLEISSRLPGNRGHFIQYSKKCTISLLLFYRVHCLICKQHLEPGRTSVSFETWL